MFDQLHTKEQLGYKVSCRRVDTFGVPGLSFVIQSAEYDPIQLQTKILDFIDSFKFEQELFTNYKNGHIARMRQGHINLFQESDEVCHNLVSFSCGQPESLDWDIRQKKIDYIEKEVTLELCERLFKEVCTGPKRNFVASRVFSYKNKEKMEHNELEKKALKGGE